MLKSSFLIFMLVPPLLEAQEQRNYWNQNLAIFLTGFLCLRNKNKELLEQVTIAYFTSDWQSILK